MTIKAIKAASMRVAKIMVDLWQHRHGLRRIGPVAADRFDQGDAGVEALGAELG